VAYRRYSKDYVDEEAEARAAGNGVWRGEFMLPWKWRQTVRQSAQR
jgi:endonuclease YncB( thermonuclease family)